MHLASSSTTFEGHFYKMINGFCTYAKFFILLQNNPIMKNFKKLLFLSVLVFGGSNYSETTANNLWSDFSSFENWMKVEENAASISFKIRGNGKGLVEIGIGPRVGSGACCRGVSKDATVSFQGNDGDVVWDSKTRRVLIELSSSSNGKTYDLRRYY